MDEIASIVATVVKNLFNVDAEINLTRPEVKFGDYATNVALQLAKELGKNPREIAEQIISELSKQDNFTSVEIAGAGFINIRLTDAYFAQELNEMLATPDDYGRPNSYKDKVVVTEYSDPNPFKVLHVGHLYTSIVGDAISNLIELAGGEVHRVNFGGDVGLHVGKTMWAIVQDLGGENPDKLTDIPEDGRSEWMAKCYVAGTRAYEDDEASKAEIISYNKQVYELFANDDHNSNFAQIYWTCRDWSYNIIDAFYARIGTKFEKYYPESSVAPLGLETVLDHPDVYTESAGARVFVGEPYGLHTRVFVNQQGLPTYEAKDVGLSLTKWQDYHFDQSVIITGNDIIEYMKVVLKSIEQFEPKLSERTLHFTHGNVKLSGAVKMSSRKGNFLRAADVIDMVTDEYQKSQGKADDSSVLGAIKYAFLKNRLGADMVFEPHESVSMTGNSGSYLQYSHARARSILRKIGFDTKDSVTKTSDFDEFERLLIVKLTEWPEILTAAVQELAPHTVCSYLYELAQTFNRFYENSHVEGDPRADIRTRLVAAYANVLRNGLTVLGISAPETM